MPAAPKKIRRRVDGEVRVEQSHDADVIATLLDSAGMETPRDFTGSNCFLVAYYGDEPVGIAGLTTEVDAALMNPIFVRERMRRRGIGSALMRAVRMAAHTRGARIVFASIPVQFMDYFANHGFAPTSQKEAHELFRQPSIVSRSGPASATPRFVVRLDISRDGLIER
jgi:N-acetylglutamate synthase-like GNAT family acetyltransferase